MPEEKIDTDKLLANINIIDVINGYVPLTKKGAEFEACCPASQQENAII